MTDLIHITITVPEKHIADAGQLARVLGYSEADGATFDDAQRIEIDGQVYARAIGMVGAGWLLPALAPLVKPEWGADMAAAARAQALLTVQDWREKPPEPDAETGEYPPEADPARIVVVIRP